MRLAAVTKHAQPAQPAQPAVRKRFGPRLGARYVVDANHVTITRSPLWLVGPVLLLGGLASWVAASELPGDTRMIGFCGALAIGFGIYVLAKTSMLVTPAVTVTRTGVQWGRTHYRAEDIAKIDEDCSMWRDGFVITVRWIIELTLRDATTRQLRLAPGGTFEGHDRETVRVDVTTAMHALVAMDVPPVHTPVFTAADGDFVELSVKDGVVYRAHCAERPHALVLELWREGSVAWSTPIALGACDATRVNLFTKAHEVLVVVHLVHPDHRVRPARWHFDEATGKPGLAPRERELQ